MSQLPHWAIKCGHQRRSNTPYAYHSATTPIRYGYCDTAYCAWYPTGKDSLARLYARCPDAATNPQKSHTQSGTAAQQHSSHSSQQARRRTPATLPRCSPDCSLLAFFLPASTHKVGSLSYPAFFDRLWLGWCRCQVRSPGRRPPYVARSAEEEISAGGLDGLLGEGDGSRVEGGWNVPGSTRGLLHPLLRTEASCEASAQFIGHSVTAS